MTGVRVFVVGAILTVGLVMSLMTLARTPSAASQPGDTATPPCATMAPQYLAVDPLTTFTDLLTQTVSARLGFALWIKVLAETGEFTMTESPKGYSAVIDLVPDAKQDLEVVGRWGWREDCPSFEARTSRARYGDPLTVVQGDPSRSMLNDLTVSGVVSALGTPVSAPIVLRPSDGRCPWSGSDADGRFEATCSEARPSTSIDVWVLAPSFYRWMRSYPVAQIDSGAKPIEVVAELTPFSGPGEPTPTPTQDGLRPQKYARQVRGVGGTPLPWALVWLTGAGDGAACISPVYTDDDGRFEVWCFGGHHSRTEWRAVVKASGYETYRSSWHYQDGWRDQIDLVPLATTTPGTGTQTPTPTPSRTPGITCTPPPCPPHPCGRFEGECPNVVCIACTPGHLPRLDQRRSATRTPTTATHGRSHTAAQPVATPTRAMLHDVTVSGVVTSLETPVSARILLHPSDGRCPWSGGYYGYRSGDDGRFALECSDARDASSIDVWVLDSDHHRWSKAYDVVAGENGVAPIDVNAVLTPRPTSPTGATPTPSPPDHPSESRFAGQVRGMQGKPVPWASVSLSFPDCLSPVFTDDSGRFEIVCFGGNALYTRWHFTVRASGYRTWEGFWYMTDPPFPFDVIQLVPLERVYFPWLATQGAFAEHERVIGPPRHPAVH